MKGIIFHYSYSRYLMGIFILMLVFCDLAGSKAQAQSSSILIYNDTTKSFNPNKELPPFGTPIIIKGYASNELKKVTITVSYGITVQKVNATISDNMWTAIVGPFPKHATVNFSIEMERRLSDTVQKEIITAVDAAIDSFYKDFIRCNCRKQTNDFFKDLQDKIKLNIDTKNINVSTSDNSPIDSVITAQFSTGKLSADFFIDLNNIVNLDSIFKSDFYIYLKTDLGGNKNAHDILQKIVKEEKIPTKNEFKALFSTLPKIDNLAENYSYFIEEPYNSYLKSKAALHSYLENLKSTSKEIVNKVTIATSISVNQNIKGIESYIGIDLGLNYIPDLAQTPPLASFSVYLRRVDPEVDYNIRNMSKDFWYIFYYLTPTVGVALNNQYSDNKIKPIYMVGLGLRLNKAVRVNGGYCYYLPENATKYNGSWTVGISISSNYIADLLQSFTALQANLPAK